MLFPDTPFELPAPNVFVIAEDDLAWTVRCSVEELVFFFRSPGEWMEALSNAAGQELTLTTNYTVELKRSPETDTDEPYVVVAGISGTGYLSVTPHAIDAEVLIAANPEWRRYWQEWVDDRMTPFQVSILLEERLCFGHLQITEQDSPESSDRVGCFLLTAFSSPARLNSLLAKRPQTPQDVNVVPPEAPEAEAIRQARKPFEPVDEVRLEELDFLLVGDQQTNSMSCALPNGTWDPDPQIMILNGVPVKMYRYIPPPPPPVPEGPTT